MAMRILLMKYVIFVGHSWSIVVTRGQSWSPVVIRGHSWSLVVIRVTRGHSCVLLDKIVVASISRVLFAIGKSFFSTRSI